MTDPWASLPADVRQQIRVAAIDKLSGQLQQIQARLAAAIDEADHRHLRRQQERVRAALESARRLT